MKQVLLQLLILLLFVSFSPGETDDLNSRQVGILKLLAEKKGELTSLKMSLPPLIEEDAESGLIKWLIGDPDDTLRAMVDEVNVKRRELFVIRTQMYPDRFPTKADAAKNYGRIRKTDDEKLFPNTLFRCGGSSTFCEIVVPVLGGAFLEEEGYQNVSVSKKGKGTILVSALKEGATRKDAIEFSSMDSQEVFNFSEMAFGFFGGELKEEYEGEFIPIAKDGLGVIIHPRNLVSEVSIEHIKSVLEGNLSSWSPLGGEGGINLYLRGDQSGIIANLKNTLGISSFSRIAKRVETDEQVEDAVFNDSKGMGVVPMSYASRGENKPLRLINDQNVSKRPTLLTVMKEEYGLTRTFYIWIPDTDTLDPIAEKFLSFCRSASGVRAIEKAGFVPYQE